MIVTTLWLGLIGGTDDYIKVFKKDKGGLKGWTKIIGQVGLGLIIGMTMLVHEDIVIRVPIEQAQALDLKVVGQQTNDFVYVKSTLTNVPFLKGNNFDYKSIVNIFGDNADVFAWVVFILIVVFIITSVSNGANLTDCLFIHI